MHYRLFSLFGLFMAWPHAAWAVPEGPKVIFSDSEKKVIVHRVEKAFGDDLMSYKEAKAAAIREAEFEVLKKAGSYLESVTLFDGGRISSERIAVVASGVLRTEVVAQRAYISEKGVSVIEISIRAEVDPVDDLTIKDRIENILTNEDLYREIERKNNEIQSLLHKIDVLDRKNRELLSSASTPETEAKRAVLRKELSEAINKLWLVHRVEQYSSLRIDEIGAEGSVATVAILRPYSTLDIRLLEAIAKGDVEDFDSALESGADVDAEISGTNPLSIATREGNHSMLSRLLESGADPDRSPEGGMGPLQLAVSRSDETAVEVLLASGARTNLRYDEEMTILMYASLEGEETIVRMLVENGANVKSKADEGMTALMLASRGGHEGIVSYLVSHEANINSRTDSGISALTFSSSLESSRVAEFLMDNGANVNVRTDQGATLLHLAARAGSYEVAQLLIDRGVDVNARLDIGGTAALFASREGHVDVVRLLFDNGAGLDVATDGGLVPLLVAAREGHTDVVRFLLEKQVYVDPVIGNGTTPLIFSTERGHWDIAEMLIQGGANVNASTDDLGTTVLMFATLGGHARIMDLLIRSGAEVDAGTTNNGTTALILAAEKGEGEAVTLLLDRGAGINARLHGKEDNGWTALMSAVYGGHLEVVKILLGRGADVNLKFKVDGPYLNWGALDFAEESDAEEIAVELRAFGAVSSREQSAESPGES